jgi:hypothetical protein
MTTEEFRILKKSVAEAYAKHENEDLLKQVDSLTAKVDELKEYLDPFWNEEPPKGLDPTFYRTLSYEGDLKIYNKVQALKE